MRCAECGESGHPAHLCFQWCESDLKRLAVRERALRAKVEWGLPVREWAFGCPGEVFPAPSAIVSRGMIEAVRVSGATWMELGDAILAGRPIRLVTLATWPDRSQILGGVLAGVRVYMMGDDNGMVTWHDRERQARRVLSDRWPSVADWEFPINPRDEGPPITHRQWMELERQLLT